MKIQVYLVTPFFKQVLIFSWKKLFFLIIEIRETIVLNLYLKIDIFWGHEDLELYLHRVLA